MDMIGTVGLSSPDYVGTDQPAPAGTVREFLDPGTGEIIYCSPVRNTSGAALVQYAVVAYASGSETAVAYAGADAAMATLAGALRRQLANNEWGWATKRGRTQLVSDAAVAANALLVVKAASAATGRVDDPAIGGLEHEILGRSIGSTTAAGVAFQAFMTLP